MIGNLNIKVNAMREREGGVLILMLVYECQYHFESVELSQCFSHKTIAAEVGVTATTKIDLRMMEELAATILLHLLKGILKNYRVQILDILL